jgi:ribosomal protein S18 acetylase RimI-like enzyme
METSSIYIVTKNDVLAMKSDRLQMMIYTNFINLAANPQLNHNMQEINRLINSPTAQIYFYLVNNKIASYLVGEVMNLNDGRAVLYITYLYTGKNFRNKGIASKLMKFAEQVASQNSLDGLMLTCDTEDQGVFEFYQLRGFMQDFQLRTYGKYDVFYKGL